jgi:hypothetical protein
MKFLPAAVTLSCVALLVSGCRKAADNAEVEKQVQERLAEEHQAQQQRELHEREAALDERERLLSEREQQLTVVATPPPIQNAPSAPLATPSAQPPAVSPDASYQTFYDNLSSYGAWVEMPGYGYVWQPAAGLQDPRWRPYTLGHWDFTDDGWTWVSDEPFGWITYHYGRWMRTHTLGWVWVPGDQWAPAWVSWRYGNDFVGWAPLPPEARFDGATGIQQWVDSQYNLGASDYTFVPASEFGDDSMASVAVPSDQNGAIYDDSNNETNIYYDSGAIICLGPDYEFMRSKCHRPLRPRLGLQRTGFRADGNNGAVVSGGKLQITAPRVSPTHAPAAPKSSRGRVADARLVTPSAPPPPLGAGTQPLYHPPQTANNAPNAAGVSGPATVSNPAGQSSAPPSGMRFPSQMKPAPVSPEVGAQKAPDLEAIRHDQSQKEAAEVERQRQETARAEEEKRTDQLRAAEAARAERAAVESDKAAREQSAREQVVRDQAARAVQPPSVPAGSQPSGTGRNQP